MHDCRILMVGPALEVMGGISAVVRYYFNSDLEKSVNLKYLKTHVDGSKLKKIFVAIQAFLKFPVICLTFRPHIVHVHISIYFSFYRKSVIFWLARLFGKRVVAHCHGGRFKEFYDSNRINAFFIRNLLNASHMIIVMSKRWKQTFKGFTRNEKVVILYNPVDTAIFKDSYPWENNISPKKILFMGNIGKLKGVYDILEAAPQIISCYPDVRFIFAGNGDLEGARGVSLEKEINENVEFVGWVRGETKTSYFKSSDIFLLPSFNEGLPVSVLEAMAAGLPVVSTQIGGIPDAIEDGVNGFLIEPGDILAITEKVLYLLRNPDILKEMGTKNKTKIKETFDLDIIISQLLEIYKSVL